MRRRIEQATPQQVRDRLGALALRVHRYKLETIRPRPNTPDLGDRWRADWQAAPDNYKNAVTSGDLERFAIPVGGWKEQELFHTSWAIEEAAVLRHARGEYELRHLDQTIFKADYILDGTEWVAGSLEVRPLNDEHLERDFDIAEALHAVTFPICHVKTSSTKDLRGLARLRSSTDVDEAMHELHKKMNPKKQPKKRDLRRLAKLEASAPPFLSKPFNQLSEEELNRAFDVTIERQRAYRWLLGFCLNDSDLFPAKATADLCFFDDLVPEQSGTETVRVTAEGKRRYHPNALDRVLLSVGFQAREGNYMLRFGGGFSILATPEHPRSRQSTWVEFSSPDCAPADRALAVAAARRVCERIIKDRRHGVIS